MNRIKEVLDNLDVKYEITNDYALIEFWTDTAGQDISVEINHNGTAEDIIKQFSEYAENYDVDEEVEIYAEHRGKNGVPATFRELLEDMQEAKDTLLAISNKLQEAIQTKENSLPDIVQYSIDIERIEGDAEERIRKALEGAGISVVGTGWKACWTNEEYWKSQPPIDWD